MSAKQIKRESQSVEDAKRHYKRIVSEIMDGGHGERTAQAQCMMVAWLDPVSMAIKAEQSSIRRGGNGIGRSLYGKIMLRCGAAQTAYIALREMMTGVLDADGGATLTSLSHRIGRAVISDIIANDEKFEESNEDAREIAERARAGGDGLTWNSRSCIALGSRLIDLMMSVCKTDYMSDGHSAFTIRKRVSHKRVVRYVQWSDEAVSLISHMRDARAALRPRHRAMIVEPRLWVEGDGGYLTISAPIISGATNDQTQQPENTMMVRDGLDCASQQAWEINSKVLEVAQTLWRTSDRIPSLDHKDMTDAPQRERTLAMHQSASRRARWLWAMSAANDLNGQRFWLPHRLDWRGRMHPMPTDLSHHRSDFARGLMMFGHDGNDCDFHWLGVHAANCWGHDIRRASFPARALWASKHATDMVAVGSDPLRYTMWHQADDPWQFLAACIALHDPEHYASKLPIQFDHSANALQHLVAISRSNKEGEKVNLIDCGKPIDPYNIVIQRVSRKICELAEQSDPVATAALPYVVRRILKRPIMATMYRVTRYGATQQVFKSLPHEIPASERIELSSHLAGWSIDSLLDEFPDAMAVVEWIEQSAKVCLSSNPTKLLSWHAPCGLHVVQPYRRSKRTLVKTSIGSLSIRDQSEDSPPDRRRQMRGCVPNIIQSIEASSLHATMIECAINGAPVAGVHDCVWTTSDCAKHVVMTARRQFAMVHDVDPLNGIRGEWMHRYKVDLPEIPRRGDLNLSSIADSRYLLS